MKLLHVDNHIAGAKNLWILQFPKDRPPTTEKISVELLVPSPFNTHDWIVVSQKNDQIDSLAKFQRLCEQAKVRCQAAINSSSTNEKLKKLTEEINSFTQLLKVFTELMKKLQPPDSNSTSIYL